MCVKGFRVLSALFGCSVVSNVFTDEEFLH